MSARRPRMQSHAFPVWGVIVAGPLAGWRYSLIQFVRVHCGAGVRVNVDLRCTPPNWPFPTDVRFDLDRDALQLLPGPRARRLEYEQLVKTALEHGYAKPPFEDR